MAAHCHSLCSTYASRRTKIQPLAPFSFAFSNLRTSAKFMPLNLPAVNCRMSRGRAVSAEENTAESGGVSDNLDVFKLTYLEERVKEEVLLRDGRKASPLETGIVKGEESKEQRRHFYEPKTEGNSWLWDVNGLKILVDPVLVGNLDFGIPWLYDAAKKFIKDFKLSDLSDVDCLLITQSLDDHCHLKTLKPLSQMYPNLKVISTPNAKPLLDPLFNKVTYLEPGESSEIGTGDNSKLRVLATAGPVLGPPWQRPENGYLVTSSQTQMSLYYEPHCVYDKNLLENLQADVVITPVIKQLLPNWVLVEGQENAVQLAKLLNAKYVVAMQNGELESRGLLASIIKGEGTLESFKELLSKELPDVQLSKPTPGEPLEISRP